MIELEKLEKESPVFQALTKDEQSERRIFLSLGISQLLNTSSITPRQAGIRASELLEFYLTGKVDGILIEPKTVPLKTSRRRRR